MLFFKTIQPKLRLSDNVVCFLRTKLGLRLGTDIGQSKRAHSTVVVMSGDIKPNLDNKLCNDLQIKDMRTKYCDEENTFLESDLQSKDPIEQFKIWFEDAMKNPGVSEPNAMCVGTASKDGRPSARFLLLKGFGLDGFKFYTNYKSRKGQDLEENPWAALTFYWEPLHRSTTNMLLARPNLDNLVVGRVRVEGRVEKLPETDSDEYFHSRPRDSQIGACVSDQSQVIESRAVLTSRQKELETLYKGKDLPRPQNWGGFLVVPETMEFWQGQSNRVHDRIRFRRPKPGETSDSILTHTGDNGWLYERLAP